MIKSKFKLSIIFIIAVLALSVLCSFSTIKSARAAIGPSYYLNFEQAKIGVLEESEWKMMIYDGEKTGVAVNPTNSNEKALIMSSKEDGTGIDWFHNACSLEGLEKERNVFSVDFYLTDSFGDEDQLYVQIDKGTILPFSLYGDGVRRFSLNKTGEILRNTVARNTWITMTMTYDLSKSTYDLTYQEQGESIETLATNVPTNQNMAGKPISYFRVMTQFTGDDLGYAYVDNVSITGISDTPYVNKVAISGANNEKIGEELTAAYDYISDIDVKEGASEFQWYRSTTDLIGGKLSSLQYEAISGANTKNYITTQEDAGKYLYVTVAPVDEQLRKGATIESPRLLIYDSNKVYDFENYSVGEVADGEYVFNKTGEILANVEQEKGGKVLSLSGVSSSEDVASVAFESKHLYGFKDCSVTFSLDLYLTKELSIGDKLYFNIVSKKETQEILYKAAYVYEDVLFIDDYNQFELPVEKWLTVKLITLEGAKYFIEVANNGSTIYVSPIKEVSELFSEFYDEVGISSFRVVYDGKKSSNITTVKFDNFICKKIEGVSFCSFDLGNIVQNSQFEYTFNYQKTDKIKSVVFLPTAGKFPNGLNVEGDKLVGTLKSAGEYNFTITAIDSNNNETTANFTLIVDKLLTVDFVTNGGDPINALYIGANSLIEQEIVPVRKGYHFIGWYKDQAFTQKWDYEVDVVDADIQLYAKWAKKEYMVSFYDENGEILKIDSYEYRESVAYPEIEEVQGKNFVGWFTDKEKTMLFIEGTAMPANNLMLYGKWISDGNENDKKGCSSNINTTSIIVGTCLILSSMLIIKKKARKENN